MREIKFKVSAGQTTVGYELLAYGTWKFKEVDGVWRFGTFGNKAYKRWQYTGQKDIKGKDIFEGDIARVGKKSRGNNVDYDYGTKVIRWSDWRGCWTFDDEQRDIDQSVVWAAAIYDDREVIGSIYENPELLEK